MLPVPYASALASGIWFYLLQKGMASAAPTIPLVQAEMMEMLISLPYVPD